MKHHFFIILSLLFFNINAQTHWCSYDLNRGWDAGVRGVSIDGFELVRDDNSGIRQVVRQLLRAIGRKANFKIILTQNLENAMAVLQNGQRYLIIDVDFLVKLNQRTGTEWSAISILAHEVGHHLHGFNGQSHELELGADYWSGFILQKLGASEKSAISAISYISEDFDSRTHPSRQRRVAAIRRGFRAAINN